MPQIKVPPSRQASGFKSLEEVINERRREAMTRIESAPKLAPPNDGIM
jgi:hypothetical protein